jgi:hypothetical protein
MPKKPSPSSSSAKKQPSKSPKKRSSTKAAETNADKQKRATPTQTRVTNSVIERIRSLVMGHGDVPTPPATQELHATSNPKMRKPRATPTTPLKKSRAIATKTSKKTVAHVAPLAPSLPSPPEDAHMTNTVIAPQHTDVPSASKAKSSKKPVLDSVEIPFDVDEYLREKTETTKPQFNRIRELAMAPSSRGWILVNMDEMPFVRTKLERGMHLFWRVPEGIGQMMRGDHIFLWQTGEESGIIGHGYLADLPMRFHDLNNKEVVHNLQNPGPNSHVVGVRIVSAHQCLTKEIMKSMPITNTISPPTERLPHRQPLTTEQIFALLELWYM